MAEIKAVESQNPVYADAKRQMEKTNQLRIDTTKVEKEMKREEKPKRPKMAQGAKKMHLDESLFEMNDNFVYISIISLQHDDHIDLLLIHKIEILIHSKQYLFVLHLLV